jgi:hypothetical protein
MLDFRDETISNGETGIASQLEEVKKSADRYKVNVVMMNL